MIPQLIGGLAQAAWIDLQLHYQYGFGSPYKSLIAGKGIAHPGIHVGPIPIGRWVGGAIQGEAKAGWRAGVGKFLKGGQYLGKEEWLGFNPALLTANKGLTLAEIAETGSAGSKLLAEAVGRARFVRGAAMGLRAFSIASVIAITAPIAYSAGRGLVNAAKAIRGPIGMTNTLDWGGQLASTFMTGQAATERQRSIQALEMARTTGRGYMGQEAQYMHQ